MFGNLREVAEYPDGPEATPNTTEYTYDFQGRLIVIHPAPSGSSEPIVPDTEIDYDQLGRRRQLDDPDTGTTTFKYDQNGNLIEQTLATGHTEAFTYDGLDRRETAVFAQDSTLDIVWRYDEGGAAQNAVGRLTSVVDEVGEHRFQYDALGRVNQEEHDLDNLRFEFEQTYDLLGQPLRRTYPLSGGNPVTAIENQYDNYGYLSGVEEVITGVSLVKSVVYDAALRVRSITTADGVTVGESYSRSTDLLEEIRVQRGSFVLDHLRYTFDSNGRITEMNDQRDSDRSRSYDYDGLNRLTEAAGPFGVGFSPVTLSYAYDKYGNLRQKDGVNRSYCPLVEGLPDCTGPGSHAVTAIGGVPLTYDDAGNLLSYSTRSYQWDRRNRLASALEGGVVKATYTYDHTGRRVKTVKNSGTRYFVTDDFEWDGNQATLHVFALGRRVASRSFDYVPPLAVALAPPSKPSKPDPYWAELLLVVILLGPPSFLLATLLWEARRRGWCVPRPREALATLTILVFWQGISQPALGALSDSDRDGLSD